MPQNVNSKTADKKKAATTITAAQPLPGTPVTGGTAALAIGAGQASWGAYLAGTFSLGSTLITEGSLDPSPTTTAWFPVTVELEGNPYAPPTTIITGGAAVAVGGGCAGLAQVRVRASVLATGDSVSVTLRASTAPPPPPRVVLPQQGLSLGPPLWRHPRGPMAVVGGVQTRHRAKGMIIHKVDATTLADGTTYPTSAFPLEEFTEITIYVFLSGTPTAGPTALSVIFQTLQPGLNSDPGWRAHPDDAGQTIATPGTNTDTIGRKDFTRVLGHTGRLLFKPTGVWTTSGTLTLGLAFVGKG